MRNLLTVFIASPSDLGIERRAAFELVTEVNEWLATVNWAIELVGWEDTLPGFGRPQSLINRDVERCDLFIGLLWRTWGTPPAIESQFTSGFEEEFTIALARRERSEFPEIWMFFKTVEPAQLADPGSGLQRVIAFRDSLVATKKVLFREFADVDAWKNILRSHLTKFVLSLSNRERHEPERPSPQAESASGVAPTVPVSNASAAATQLADFARTLSAAVNSGDLADIRQSVGGQQDVAFFALRGLLVSATLVAASGTSMTRLPAHAVNRLYIYRAQLCATDDELLLIFQSLLDDSDNVLPGWYWFRHLNTATLTEWLFWIVVSGTLETARIRALKVLRDGAVAIPEGLPDEVVDAIANLPPSAQEAAWDYLVDFAVSEDIVSLEPFAEGTWVESRLLWLKDWITTRGDIDQFLRQHQDLALLPAHVERLISSSMSSLAESSLTILSGASNSSLAEHAKSELRKRNLPVESVAQDFAATDNLDILGGLSAPGLASIFSKQDTKETDSATYQRLSRETTKSLKRRLEWMHSEAPTVYKLLVERGAIPRETVRSDIESRFQRLENKTYARLAARVGTEGAAQARARFADVREFIGMQFCRKALLALSPGTPDDVPIARHFLSDFAVRTTAINMIVSHGDASDVEQLLEVARTTYGPDRMLALRGVRRLASDKVQLALSLVNSEHRDFRLAGLAMSSDILPTEAIQLLMPLLVHYDEQVREHAVVRICELMDDPSIGELLTNYLMKERYFYNVVTWLDRRLYAPSPASIHYDVEVKAIIDQNESP